MRTPRPFAKANYHIVGDQELGSERLQPVRAALLAETARLNSEMAKLPAKGEVRFIDTAHVIQNDAPEAVIAATRNALD